ncbi:hypothetical protein D3C81_2187490 [compost metagenome]
MGADAVFLYQHVLAGRNRNGKTMLQGLCNMEITLDMLQPFCGNTGRLRLKQGNNPPCIQSIFRYVLPNSWQLL